MPANSGRENSAFEMSTIWTLPSGLTTNRPGSANGRSKLQTEGRKRDLALFNLAIDSKLRGCDVVAVRVDDVAPSSYALDRATICQKRIERREREQRKRDSHDSIRANALDPSGDYKGYPDWARAALSPKNHEGR